METLIAEKSYATEKTVKEYFRENNLYWSDKTYIRQLPVIIEEMGLVKVKTNSALKEQYGIISRGYPTILIKGQGN